MNTLSMEKAIAACLAQMVREKLGMSCWESVASEAGLANSGDEAVALLQANQVMRLFDAAVQHSGLGRAQFYQTFGEFWSNVFAPRHFRSWFIMSLSAKDFGRQIDRVYGIVCPECKGNQHLEPQWIDSNTIRFEYRMQPEQMELFVALIRGIAGYYKAQIQIEKTADKVAILHF